MSGTGNPTRSQPNSRSVNPKVQEHLLQFFDTLEDEQREKLSAEIAVIDFEQIKSLFAALDTQEQGLELARRAQAPENFISQDARHENPAEFSRATEAGWQALRAGRVGIVLVAGGEGTRLGFPHPKGQFPIGPVTNKSLYQLLAEQAVAIAQRAQTTIPYYVMTSDATHAKTMEFFAEHQFFGMKPEDVKFFRQGKMPAVDQKTGQVLLAAKDALALSPDGHGGLLDAMAKADLFKDMKDRGIEQLFYHQIDNPLARVCDPAFIGFHLIHQSDVSTKVVRKEDPAEKVGLLVEVDGRHHMIEYTDLPTDLAAERHSSGQLRLRCGNIAIHMFRVEFLERMSQNQDSMPYHRSSKTVTYVNTSGELIKPTENNAYKFEKFIFDVLPWAERPLAMEVDRDQEFIPLKNRTGLFSPDHVRQAMRRLHTSLLKQAGWTTADELDVEIPPAAAFELNEWIVRQANSRDSSSQLD